MWGAEDNRKGIPFVKIVSLLCKLIQFLMVALSVTVHKALILLVFLNHPYQSLAFMRLFRGRIFFFANWTENRKTQIRQSKDLKTNLIEPICPTAGVLQTRALQGIFLFLLFGSLVLQFLVRTFRIVENYVLVYRTSEVCLRTVFRSIQLLTLHRSKERFHY